MSYTGYSRSLPTAHRSLTGVSVWSALWLDLLLCSCLSPEEGFVQTGQVPPPYHCPVASVPRQPPSSGLDAVWGSRGPWHLPST